MPHRTADRLPAVLILNHSKQVNARSLNESEKLADRAWIIRMPAFALTPHGDGIAVYTCKGILLRDEEASRTLCVLELSEGIFTDLLPRQSMSAAATRNREFSGNGTKPFPMPPARWPTRTISFFRRPTASSHAWRNYRRMLSTTVSRLEQFRVLIESRDLLSARSRWKIKTNPQPDNAT